MRKLLGVFALLVMLVVGCSKEENGVDNYYGYHIRNEEGLDKESIGKEQISPDSTFLFGIKNRKIWMGLFNEQTKEQLEEWECMEMLADSVKKISAYYSLVTIKGGYIFNAELFFREDGLRDDRNKSQVLILHDNIINVIDIPGIVSVYDDMLLGGNERQFDLYSLKGELITDDVSSYKKGDSTFLAGFKRDKAWVGLYDANRKLLKEWISPNKFERTIKRYTGYGEYEEIYVEYILQISGYGSSCSISETNWGYTVLSPLGESGRWHGLFLLNESNVYFYCPESGGIDNVGEWFDESILVGRDSPIVRKVISPKGELIVNLKYFKDGEPISYTDIVSYQSESTSHYMVRSDLKEGKEIWKTKIDKLDNIQSDAKVTHTITQKNGQIWTYHYEVVNFDGSKESFDFSINLETGVLTYL